VETAGAGTSFKKNEEAILGEMAPQRRSREEAEALIDKEQ
jgi:hypothetical protein